MYREEKKKNDAQIETHNPKRGCKKWKDKEETATSEPFALKKKKKEGKEEDTVKDCRTRKLED